MGQIEVTSFQTTNWMPLYGFTPTYNAYISQRSAVPGFQYCKRVFKLLQWKNPRQRWLLKSPMSLVSLPDLFAVFPDLRLIWMHRDPIKAVSSLVSLIGTLYWIRSDRQMGEEAIAHLTNPAGLSNLFNKVIDEIERGEVPVAQVHNVQYSDFVNEPMKTVEALYRDIGIPLTGQASQEMRDYIRDNPRQNRPPHNYSVGDIKRFGEERKLFDRYQKYFDVKNEV
jgi:hypothetical protein